MMLAKKMSHAGWFVTMTQIASSGPLHVEACPLMSVHSGISTILRNSPMVFVQDLVASVGQQRKPMGVAWQFPQRGDPDIDPNIP